MTPIRVTLAVVLALAGAQVLAESAPMVTDTDGDGTFSLAEIQAAFPDVTAETYTKIDTNSDGAVSPDELIAAIDGGMLKTQG